MQHGRVNIHAITIVFIIFQFIVLLFMYPDPIIEPEAACVVLTGKPRVDAKKIIKPQLISAAILFEGPSFDNFVVKVFTMRIPPVKVPIAIVDAQIKITHNGIPDVLGTTLKLNKAKVIIDIVFCVSLDP